MNPGMAAVMVVMVVVVMMMMMVVMAAMMMVAAGGGRAGQHQSADEGRRINHMSKHAILFPSAEAAPSAASAGEERHAKQDRSGARMVNAASPDRMVKRR
jgi:flagellar basal body-associated protein FliL